MASNGGNLTHDEIWDDSALVDSWNEALEEYKKYHSIHAKGGNVNDLIDSSSAQKDTEMTSNIASKRPEDPAGDMKPAEDHPQEQSLPHGHPSPAAPSAPAGPPIGLLGTVRDEGLKRLLMSWYYAGYYTGYYEGQREQPADQGGSRQ